MISITFKSLGSTTSIQAFYGLYHHNVKASSLYTNFFWRPSLGLLHPLASFPSFLSKPWICYSRRYMHSTRAAISSVARKSIGTPSNSATLTRGYACYTCNKPESTPTDPQALVNNPTVIKDGKAIRHTDVQKATCDEIDCEKKICPPSIVCGNPEKITVIGNPTTGTGKKTGPDGVLLQKVSRVQFNGKVGWQNIFIFKKPHATQKTPEYPQGTKALNDPTVVNTVHDTHKKLTDNETQQ